MFQYEPRFELNSLRVFQIRVWNTEIYVIEYEHEVCVFKVSKVANNSLYIGYQDIVSIEILKYSGYYSIDLPMYSRQFYLQFAVFL